MPASFPAPSIRKVARSMPMYLRPYRLFSPQTPYDSVALPVSSAASVTFSLCLPLNLSWLATLSREQPITPAPSLSNFALAALNSMASLVRPEDLRVGNEFGSTFRFRWFHYLL